MKSRAKFKIDVRLKTENPDAFARIVCMNGMHKLPYTCTVYSDGCGSMNLVRDMATRMGLNHQFIPPHEQSLNEAEKVCDRMWASARVHLIHTQQSIKLMAEAVSYSMYVDLRMATNAQRDWLTPYEIVTGSKPSIAHLRPAIQYTLLCNRP